MTQDFTVLFEYRLAGQAGLNGGRVTLRGCTSAAGARRRFVTESVLRGIARAAGCDRHDLRTVRAVRVTQAKAGRA